ncbi:MAG: N-acetyltransferase [Anaerolinea sp.]|nr:N-acetyltransferase [Anaerolinea sp.]
MAANIHPTALVSPSAQLGDDCTIGAYTIIHDHVSLGSNSTVEAFCELGYPQKDMGASPLVIGDHAHIRSYSLFYQGSIFGDHLHTGHRVTVREKTSAGRYFSVGTLGDIQGHCQIGDYTRFHSNVHIGQKSSIGNFVWIFPYTVLTNDPHPPSYALVGVHVDDYAIIATMTTILPGVHIGSEALVGAMSLVNKDVPARTIVFGVPAKERGTVTQVMDAEGNAVYPWFPNNKDRYPAETEQLWEAYLIARQAQLNPDEGTL